MKRRNFLKIGASATAGLLSANVLAANQCRPTPQQAEGPFYPVHGQIDTDADLIYVGGSHQPADGQIIIVEGIVTDQSCRPVQGVLVEIWQACKTGRYNHPSDTNTAELDPHFQYWGKAVTDTGGRYRFRTLIPGAYPNDPTWMRPPHIHFKVSKKGHMELITQMYFAGEELNQQDLILQRLRPDQQKDVIVDFKGVAGQAHPVGVFNIQIEKL